jgi:hypothetical protein
MSSEPKEIIAIYIGPRTYVVTRQDAIQHMLETQFIYDGVTYFALDLDPPNAFIAIDGEGFYAFINPYIDCYQLIELESFEHSDFTYISYLVQPTWEPPPSRVYQPWDVLQVDDDEKSQYAVSQSVLIPMLNISMHVLRIPFMYPTGRALDALGRAREFFSASTLQPLPPFDPRDQLFHDIIEIPTGVLQVLPNIEDVPEETVLLRYMPVWMTDSIDFWIRVIRNRPYPNTPPRQSSVCGLQ